MISLYYNGDIFSYEFAKGNCKNVLNYINNAIIAQYN